MEAEAQVRVLARLDSNTFLANMYVSTILFSILSDWCFVLFGSFRGVLAILKSKVLLCHPAPNSPAWGLSLQSSGITGVVCSDMATP